MGGCYFYCLPIHSQFTAIIHLQLIMWVWFSSAELSIVSLAHLKTCYNLLLQHSSSGEDVFYSAWVLFSQKDYFLSPPSPPTRAESHSNNTKRVCMYSDNDKLFSGYFDAEEDCIDWITVGVFFFLLFFDLYSSDSLSIKTKMCLECLRCLSNLFDYF